MIFSIKVAKAIISIAMPMTRFAVSFFRGITPFCVLDFGERRRTLCEHSAAGRAVYPPG